MPLNVAKEDAATPPNVGANKEDAAAPPNVGADEDDAAAPPNVGADKEDAAAPAALLNLAHLILCWIGPVGRRETLSLLEDSLSSCWTQAQVKMANIALELSEPEESLLLRTLLMCSSLIKCNVRTMHFNLM